MFIHSRGILLFKIKALFASALSPTFRRFVFKVMSLVCLEVKIWLKFKIVHLLTAIDNVASNVLHKVIAITIYGGLGAHVVTCLGGLVYGW